MCAPSDGKRGEKTGGDKFLLRFSRILLRKSNADRRAVLISQLQRHLLDNGLFTWGEVLLDVVFLAAASALAAVSILYKERNFTNFSSSFIRKLKEADVLSFTEFM